MLGAGHALLDFNSFRRAMQAFRGELRPQAASSGDYSSTADHGMPVSDGAQRPRIFPRFFRKKGAGSDFELELEPWLERGVCRIIRLRGRAHS